MKYHLVCTCVSGVNTGRITPDLACLEVRRTGPPDPEAQGQIKLGLRFFYCQQSNTSPKPAARSTKLILV